MQTQIMLYLDQIYLVYALSFLFLGFVLYVQAVDSDIELKRLFTSLLFFALLHGLAETIDWLQLMSGPTLSGKWFVALATVASFYYLLQFGKQSVIYSLNQGSPMRARYDSIWALPNIADFALISLIVLFAYLSQDTKVGLENAARFFMALPGGVLASAAVLLSRKHFQSVCHDRTLLHMLTALSPLFFGYAVFAGLVVKADDFWSNFSIDTARFIDLLGVPVQLIRALIALLLALTLSAILRKINLITSQERAKKSDEMADLFEQFFKQSAEAVLVTDANNRIIGVNPAFTRISGYTLEDIKGKDPRILSSGKHSREFYQNMWSAILKDGMWQGDLCDKRKNGEEYTKWTSISVVRNKAGDIINYYAIYYDVTAQRKTEQQHAYFAHHDALTGLHNRFSMILRLKQALADARRRNAKFALLFIDLDKFKEINDNYGHGVGDALLIEVAQRLQLLTRECDAIARFGGDEFVLLLTDLNSAEQAALVANKLVSELNKPYHIKILTLYVSSSIGISLFPDGGLDVDALLERADHAMYLSKNSGGNCYRIFTMDG